MNEMQIIISLPVIRIVQVFWWENGTQNLQHRFIYGEFKCLNSFSLVFKVERDCFFIEKFWLTWA